MRRERGKLERPLVQVAVQEGHHGRAPDIAQPAFGEGRAQANVIVVRAQMLVRLAVGEVRAIDQLERHAAHVGIHPRLVSRQVSRRPLFRPAALELLNQAHPIRLQGHPGVQHPDPPAGVQQRLRASHACRPGPDHVAKLRVGNAAGGLHPALRFLLGSRVRHRRLIIAAPCLPHNPKSPRLGTGRNLPVPPCGAEHQRRRRAAFRLKEHGRGPRAPAWQHRSSAGVSP